MRVARPATLASVAAVLALCTGVASVSAQGVRTNSSRPRVETHVDTTVVRLAPSEDVLVARGDTLLWITRSVATPASDAVRAADTTFVLIAPDSVYALRGHRRIPVLPFEAKGLRLLHESALFEQRVGGPPS